MLIYFSHLVVQSGSLLLSRGSATLRRPRCRFDASRPSCGGGASFLRSINSDVSATASNPSAELGDLQNELWLIEAIEARNAAQVR
jgi:hypothetical protein